LRDVARQLALLATDVGKPSRASLLVNDSFLLSRNILGHKASALRVLLELAHLASHLVRAGKPLLVRLLQAVRELQLLWSVAATAHAALHGRKHLLLALGRATRKLVTSTSKLVCLTRLRWATDGLALNSRLHRFSLRTVDLRGCARAAAAVCNVWRASHRAVLGRQRRLARGDVHATATKRVEAGLALLSLFLLKTTTLSLGSGE
jgi:hypothetical protein